MADLELIEDRIISGTGLLRIPQDDEQPVRYGLVLLDVVRKPKNIYLNFAWKPERSRYANIVYLRNEYVVGTHAMEYEREALDGVADITGQVLRAVKCAYQGVLQSFVNLAIAIPSSAPPTEVVNLIKDYESLSLGWDTCVIKCYADTAIQARLFQLKYDVCDPEFDKQFKLPPPPPPLPQVPPGTPIADISANYDDDDITDPFEGDEQTPDLPEPPGVRCRLYRVTVRVWADWGEPDGFSQGFPYRDLTEDFYGEVVLVPSVIRTLVSNFGTPPGGCLSSPQQTVLATAPSDPGYPPREIVGFVEISPP